MRKYLLHLIERAKDEGLHVRVFDFRYATQGLPHVLESVVVFPAGSYEVLETGHLQKPAFSVEKLPFEKGIDIEALIHAELTFPVGEK